jgi:membrane protein implicated in regulation of membrane protease activity
MTFQQIVEVVWLALLIIFAGLEGISVGLTSIWFAAGALCALVVALLGGGLWLQIVVFIVVSALCMLAIRPLAKKILTPRVQATNADRIIGQEALVTEDIDDLQGKGAVVIGGVTWTARSGTDQIIPNGTKVKVLRIEGVKVFVETVKEEVKCSSSN